MTWLSEYAGIIGLLFFFAFFLAVLLWVFRPGSKADYQKKAQIPLKEDESDE